MGQVECFHWFGNIDVTTEHVPGLMYNLSSVVLSLDYEHDVWLDKEEEDVLYLTTKGTRGDVWLEKEDWMMTRKLFWS